MAATVLLVACGDDSSCPIDLSTGQDCNGVYVDGRFPADRCRAAAINTLQSCPIYVDGQPVTSVGAANQCAQWHSEPSCAALIEAVLSCWDQRPPECTCTDEVDAAQNCWRM